MQHGKPRHPSSYHHMNDASQDLVKAYMRIYDSMGYFDKDLVADCQEMFSISHIYAKWFNELMTEPNKIYEAQTHYLKDFFSLCMNMQSFFTDKRKPLITPSPTDKRFSSPEWDNHPLFHFLQQSYLLFVEHCLAFIEQNPSHDPFLNKQILFFSRNYLNALSPTNFFLTNPDILQYTLDNKGENLVQGLINLFDDVSRNKGHYNIKMTDTDAFEVGKNIAITPGKVVFQNRMMQLIQYSPTTEKVYQRPLLIVPPWINKYYVLDMREKNSLVKWIVDQGYTVFIISWINPDKNYYSTDFEDYMLEGTMAAIDAVCKATSEEKINALGFCIGGTLLSCTLSYMHETRDNRIESATFLASLIDFTEPGDIKVFFDEEQMTVLEERMKKEGVLDGRMLMTTFNLLRPNDLYWPYYINNYLCGKTPLAFDLLYWNSDPANLPGKMISYYVRHMYMDNLLCKPGGITLGGVAIDLSKVTLPCYFLSTDHDHIAPWEATFSGAKCMGGPITFVLGGAGHIAGIVNPPPNNKYGYRYSDADFNDFKTARDWLSQTKSESESWWVHWSKWLKKFAGKKVPARIPGEGKLAVIQDAPGDYVKKRL